MEADVLGGGSVELHHYRHWLAEFLQLQQEVHPLLGLVMRELMFSSPLRSWC